MSVALCTEMRRSALSPLPLAAAAGLELATLTDGLRRGENNPESRGEPGAGAAPPVATAGCAGTGKAPLLPAFLASDLRTDADADADVDASALDLDRGVGGDAAPTTGIPE